MVAGPLARLIAQITVIGAGIVSRAFVQAYQQAAANARAGGGQTAQQAKRVIRNKMSQDEALKILNFEAMPKSYDEVVAQYDKYFTANDPKKGGSFYVQSKVFRAKETLEQDFKSEQTSASTGANGDETKQ